MIDVKTSIGKCPPEYPFPYNYGEKCCQDNKDAAGNVLTLRSAHCIAESNANMALVYCHTSGVPPSHFCKNGGMCHILYIILVYALRDIQYMFYRIKKLMQMFLFSGVCTANSHCTGAGEVCISPGTITSTCGV